MIYIEPATSARYEFCGIEGLPVLGVGEVVKLVSSKDDLTTAGPLDAVCQWEGGCRKHFNMLKICVS
jgi:hypothetical protein